MYQYDHATCVGVYPCGTAVDMEIDLGFGITKKERLGLFGIRAPNEYDTSRQGENLARFVSELILGRPVALKVHKSRTSGNYLAVVFLSGLGSSINVSAVDNNVALPGEGWIRARNCRLTS